jgi:Ca-activated chloride channel family protein
MSTPRINPNDPKWTAYVLGELDEADRASVERLLETSAEARALVNELSAGASALRQALTSELAELLTAAQRAALRNAADTDRARWFARVPVRWSWGLGAAAAAVIVAAVAPLLPERPLPAAVSTAAPARSMTEAPQTAPQAAVPITQPSAAPAKAPAVASTPALRVEPAPTPNTGATATTAPASINAVSGVSPGVTAGAVAESVSVTAEAPAVDVQSARRGGAAANQGRLIVPGGVPGGVVGGVVGFLTPSPAAVAPAPAPLPSPVRPAFPSDGAVYFPRPPIGTESYARVAENVFVRASQEPLATFSIDVDTASYSNVRRFLNMNQLPPADAVRIEELVNYFTYDYARPSGVHPIGASMEVADAPWNSAHRLVRIGVKARDVDAKQRPPSNLVFLIDVSGSMNMPQKLPLVKSGLKMLVDQLGENDMVSIVVYAGTSGLVLPPTSGERKGLIAQAIDNLQAGGSTNGGAGIQLAYQQASNNFIRGGVNRVILVTDGDFNVGITSQSDLTRLIEDRARSGVFLSVLGFGMGNLKDSTMERLADMGNGHYAYIDTLNEARKVLVEEMSSTLVTVAKDVKIQVDFNPSKVEAYRLIGYENRALRPEDFNNDLKDAGEMGAGHTVTALFEIVPRGGSVPGPSIDPSVFQPAPRAAPAPTSTSNDLLVLRVRYKQPDASESTRMDVPLPDRRRTFADASSDFRFAASVAAFGMILKNSQYRGDVTLPWVLDTATASRGQDRGGYRAEFISLVQRAMALGTTLGR